MVKHSNMKHTSRKETIIIVGIDVSSVGRADLSCSITDKVQHHLGIIVQLNAEPIPTATTESQEIAPLVIHPCLSSHRKRLVMIDKRTREGHASSRVVVREAAESIVHNTHLTFSALVCILLRKGGD